MRQKSYPSKVLLFGEYTVLFGGQALAIPYPKYFGQWIAKQEQTTYDISPFFDYLRQINVELHAPLDFGTLVQLEKRYSYVSNIPPGIGLGSSAALSASVYDLCSTPAEYSLREKKQDLALIESYFHGKSSGFDALVSFEKKSLIQDKQGLTRLDNLPPSPLDIYLVFTNSTRDSHRLIEQFQNKCTNLLFKKRMELLADLSSKMIDKFITGNPSLNILEKISELQFDALEFLISPEIRESWKNSLDDPNVYMKICGAGGGGCYLLFTRHDQTLEILPGFSVEKIII